MTCQDRGIRHRDDSAQPEPTPDEPATASGTARPPVWRRTVSLLLFFLVFNFLVVPQLGGARRAVDVLGDVEPILLLAALGLQLASLVAYGELTRTALPDDAALPLPTVVRVQLATRAVSHLVPGGSAAGSTLGLRLLTDAGVTPTHAGFALAAVGLGSAVVLNALLWVALAVSIPINGLSAAYGSAALTGLVLLALVAALIMVMSRGEERADRILRAVAARLPFVEPDTASRLVRQVSDRVSDLRTDPALVRRGLRWASINWVLDAASLWVFLAAFGSVTNPVNVLVAFGLANVAAVIPLTPGGLGVVEAVLTSSLTGFGVDRGTAAIAVVTYRLASFWLPIPLGGAALASLRYGPRSLRRMRMGDNLRTIADEAASVHRHVWDVEEGNPPD